MLRTQDKAIIGFLALLTSLSFALFIMTALNAKISTTSKTCDIQAIFARGSGERIDDKTSSHFFEQLAAHIPNIEIYELGSTNTYGEPYPAVEAGITNLQTTVGAWLSAGTGYEYGHSVNDGVNELYNYLKTQSSQCPNTHYILGGYSQGAQVVGQALQSIPREIRDNIIFTALFGDPKLHLPEGEGILPPACLGEQFSPWRREVENCFTNSGILFARNPYIPDDMKNKTGLWCKKFDVVCGSTPLWDDHGKYAEEGGPIDKATNEIAALTQTELDKHAADPPTYIDPRTTAHVIIPADIMLDVDTSPGITDEEYKNIITPISLAIRNQADSKEAGVGLTLFDSCTNNLVAQPYASLQSFTYHLEHPTRSLKICDTAHTLYASIENSILMPAWRSDANKIVVVFTKTPYDKTRILQIAALNQAESGSVYRIFMVDITKEEPQLQLISSATGTSNPIDIPTLIDSTIRYPQANARLTASSYNATVGEEVTFDASSSSAYDTTICDYYWDFNNDGHFDSRSSEPRVSHTYEYPFDGEMSVRVRPCEGWEELDSAFVHIKDKNEQDEIRIQEPSILFTTPTTVKLAWQAAKQAVLTWNIQLNDALLGRISGERQSIEVRDVDTRQVNNFVVTATYAPPASLYSPLSPPPSSINNPQTDTPAAFSRKTIIQPPRTSPKSVITPLSLCLVVASLVAYNYRFFRF